MLYEKIAFRWFVKEAGTFDPPPEVVEDVRDFMVSRYAGHILAKTQDRLAELQEEKEDYERIYQNVKETYNNTRGWDDELREKGYVHFTLRPDKDPQKGIVIRPETDPHDPYYMYQYTKGEEPYGRTYGPYTRREMVDKLYNAFTNALDELYEKKRNMQQVAEDKDYSLVELTRIREKASEYAEEARAYKSTARTTIEVDLTGWSYVEDALKSAEKKVQGRIEDILEERKTIDEDIQSLNVGDSTTFDFRYLDGQGVSIERADRFLVEVTKVDDSEFKVVEKGKEFGDYKAAEDVLLRELHHLSVDAVEVCREVADTLSLSYLHDQLVDMEYHEFTAILHFKGHTSRGGQWRPTDRELEVDVPGDAKTLDQFEDRLERIVEISKHETQHVGQKLLEKLKDLPEIAGLPSEHIRDDDYDPWGNSENSMYEREHALKDIEFQTRLTQEISRFADIVEDIPYEHRRRAFRVWVGDANEGDKEKMREVSKQMDLNWRKKVRTTSFFQKIKRVEPDKWEKAIKTFLAELNKKGIDLPSES